MKKNFQLVRARNSNEKIDIDSLEKQYHIYLPPIFKIFVDYFFVGKDCLLVDKFYHPIHKDYYSFVEVQYEPTLYGSNKPISITNIEDIKELFPEWALSIYEKEWKEFSLLRITNISTGGNLFVGTTGDMTDAIFRVVWDSENPNPEKIANNILDFISGLETLELPEAIMTVYGVKFSQCYKNWGEDFWRVREEDGKIRSE